MNVFTVGYGTNLLYIRICDCQDAFAHAKNCTPEKIKREDRCQHAIESKGILPI